jgi:hypothetical protein
LWAPSFIIFEREHFDRGMYRQATRMLRKAGYRCVDVWPDTLAYRHAPRSGPQASPPREQGARDASAPRA